MPTQFFVTVTGAKQGAFKGESTQKGREGKIPGVAFSYGVLSPRDPTSGLPTGKRQHQPVVFSKEWGISSPQFYEAIYTNESLPTVLFEFFVAGPTGVIALNHTIKLTNASISAIRQTLPDNQPVGSQDPRELQEISFTFQKIDIVSVNGGTEASDDWETPTT
jgi:type VI secretion system secreted protein Hcp